MMDKHTLAWKLSQIAAEVGPVDPAGVNEHARYRYIGYDQLNGILAPLLAKYGVSIVYSFDEIDERDISVNGKSWIRSTVKGTAIISHDAPEETIRAGIIGCSQDTSGKSAAQAITEAVKRFLLKLFLVSTFDDVDPDSQSCPPSATAAGVKKEDFIQKSAPRGGTGSPIGAAGPNSEISGKNLNAGTMVPGTKFSGEKQGSAAGAPPAAGGQRKDAIISEPQRKRLFAIASSKGWSYQEVEDFVQSWGFASTKEISRARYEGICNFFETDSGRKEH